MAKALVELATRPDMRPHDDVQIPLRCCHPIFPLENTGEVRIPHGERCLLGNRKSVLLEALAGAGSKEYIKPNPRPSRTGIRNFKTTKTLN